MPWVNKKQIKPECPHKSLPPLRGGVDFAERSVYACDECGEEFVYLIKYDIPVWDKPKAQIIHKVNAFNRLEGLSGPEYDPTIGHRERKS